MVIPITTKRRFESLFFISAWIISCIGAKVVTFKSFIAQNLPLSYILGMNIKSIASKIGIDYENVVGDFCGDVSALSSKLQSFASSDAIEQIKKALDSSNTEEVKKIAHTIRKDSEKVGLTAIAKAARRVEDADVDKIKNATITLIYKLEEASAAIKKPEEE